MEAKGQRVSGLHFSRLVEKNKSTRDLNSKEFYSLRSQEGLFLEGVNYMEKIEEFSENSNHAPVQKNNGE